MTIDEIQARRSEIRTRLQEIDAEFEGQEIPEHAASEWNGLNEEEDRLATLQTELEARQSRLAELSDSTANRSEPASGVAFQTRRPGSTRGEDIWDMSSLRQYGPEESRRELRDRAMQAVERSQFPHPQLAREDAQGHLERLLSVRETRDGGVSRHLLATGSPTYHRAFQKSLEGSPLSQSEGAALQAALSVGTDSAGGFAVPFQLDPTVIPSSNGSVNPYRSISRVETLVGTNEWRGVRSDGVTAGYSQEATEVGDDSPTLAQPSVTVERADAFVPFSIEVGQDWGGLQSEMASAIQDAKDDLEADKFTNGTGTNEPEGVIVGATNVVETAAARTFAVGDVYATEEALPPRFRPRAQWVGNRSIYNLVRQFDTNGGANLWVDSLQRGLANNVPTPGNIGAALLGYPANEASNMDSDTGTAGEAILVLGDFRHYLIAERLGMTIEVVPHLFATANNRPSGQRGLLAYWRNSAVVLAANAFRVLEIGSGS